MADLCPDDEYAKVMQAVADEPGNDTTRLNDLLARWPRDPRLHFMLASLQVANKDHIAAHSSFSRAIELAPDFLIARYQFGFFAMTSGDADEALSIWGPLFRLSDDAYLRQFVEGMAHLIRDEFAQAIERFERGILLNTENLPLNGDISLLVSECRKLLAKPAAEPAQDGGEEASATSFILNQFSSGSTRH
ncbi:tetratricopeptide repeat protein [Novosphingobium beihaiensis]|uniref:Tetratricopeptide repeat protein n=1 Tax=Novosphingobium beihaiensis TaxID=2930389 RepID=A0ABT0BPJ7_9SPHN|nr:hypothetical protein [Novosphingobium beihaiensis]MCJ2186979.1 hypothetical protein [Novosphingobium beihaiensis]